MAKLNNKEREIIVEELFNKISTPIIEENKELLKNAPYDDKHPYFKDVEAYEESRKEIDRLLELQEVIRDKWHNKEIEGYELGCWNIMEQKDELINHLKTKNTKVKEYPSRQELEKEVILAGNKDIPMLIESIINKYK